MVDKAPMLSFSVKAPSLLTHNIDNNWQKNGDSFIAAVSAMGDNLKAVLFQFPQSFHKLNSVRIIPPFKVAIGAR